MDLTSTKRSNTINVTIYVNDWDLKGGGGGGGDMAAWLLEQLIMEEL